MAKMVLLKSWNVQRVLLMGLLFCIFATAAEKPNIMVALISRNSEQTLPYVLGGLETQKYPTQKMHLWIRTDCNMDQTANLLSKWTEAVRDRYASVDLEILPCQRPGEKFPFISDEVRQHHVDNLRDEAIKAARKLNCEYILFLDSSVFIVEPLTISDLLFVKKDIVGPLLPGLNKYGNFWCNATDQGRYFRTDDCEEVFEFMKLGVFDVGLVHGVVLIDLTSPRTAMIAFSSPNSDMRPYQQFIQSTAAAGASMSLINEKQYGYSLSPLADGSTFADQLDSLRNLQLEVLVKRDDIPRTPHLQIEQDDPDTLGFDHIYLINLDRRPERRMRLERSFEILGIEVERISAVDGQNLNQDVLDKMGIRMLPGYRDPHRKRPMTMGEYGCFLSHYAIWRDVTEKGFRQVLVLEDDIRFDYYVRQRMSRIWADVDRLQLDWDLIYLGRKRLIDEDEPYVKGSKNLVHVGYSYWTLSYMLSDSGASKLLAGEPLTRVIPVDEYLPIMFNRHPNEQWKSHFPVRDLVAFSAYPLLVYPTHYTGEEGYVSDTENSTELVLEEEKLEEAIMVLGDSHPSHDEL